MSRVRWGGAFINCDDVIIGQESDGSHRRHPSHPLSPGLHAHTPRALQLTDAVTGDAEEERQGSCRVLNLLLQDRQRESV